METDEVYAQMTLQPLSPVLYFSVFDMCLCESSNFHDVLT